VGSTFSQQDVDDERISYRLTSLPQTTVRDQVELHVSAPGTDQSTATTTTTFDIIYEPDGGDLWLVNNGLMDVEEGDSITSRVVVGTKVRNYRGPEWMYAITHSVAR